MDSSLFFCDIGMTILSQLRSPRRVGVCATAVWRAC